MSELPEGWVATQLGPLLKSIVGGGTPSKANPAYFRGSIPFMTVKDLHVRFVADTQDHISDAALKDSASTLVPADTLIVATRMSLGKITRPLVPTAINQDLKALFLHEGVDKTYVEYLWQANEARIQGMGTGTTVKGIRLEDIRGLDVPLAPMAEQTRIANQLDTLLARIQSCNSRFDAIPSLLKRFRQAVLNSAVVGRMTPIIDALSEPLRNGKSVRDGNGLPVLRLTALKSQIVNLNEVKYGYWSDVADTDRFLVHDGDYLVSRGNGSKDYVGRGGLVVGCNQPIAFPDTMIRFRPDVSQLLPGYLQLVWESEGVRTQIASSAKTTAGIWKVSQTDLERIRIPLPSLSQQAEIVRRVEALFALADRMEVRATAARTQAQRLSPLTLAKAFRGELVQQDPQDEPASALLERIASQRTEPTAKKQSKTPRQVRASRAPKEAAAVTKSRQDEDVKGKPYLADHLRRLGSLTTAEELFKASELPVGDFYKQLAWEVAQGHIADGGTTLEARHAAG